MHRHCCRVWALPPSLGAPAEFVSLFAEFGCSRQVWALPPETAMKSTIGPSLGAPAPAEFGRSRQKHKDPALLGGDNLYLHAYICVLFCQY